MERERLVTGYTGHVSVLVAAGWLAISMGREALPPLLPVLRADLGITPAAAGVALTLQWGVYSLAQYPGGQLSDGRSRTGVIVAGLTATLVGVTLLTTVGGSSYPLFLLSLAVIGLGGGIYYVPSRALLSDLFVERRGQAFGFQSAAGNLGSALAPVVVLGALGVGVWQSTYIPVALVLLAVVGLLFTLSKEDGEDGVAGFDLRATVRRIAQRRRQRRALVAYTLFAFGWSALVAFLPTYLQEDAGYSVAVASAGYSALFLTGIAMGPVAGYLSDRISGVLITVTSMLLGAVGVGTMLGATALPTGVEPFVAVGGILLAALGLRSYPPVMQARLLEEFPSETVGGDFGVFKTLYTGVGSLGPAYVGFVSGGGDYATAFWGVVACLTVGAVVTGWTFAGAADPQHDG